MVSWLHRVVLGGLLLIAYLYAWTPARTAYTQYGIAPALAWVAGPNQTVSARPAAHTIRVDSASGAGLTVRAPAGVKFLLAAGALIMLVPSRPPLGLFFGGHLLLGLLTGGLAGAALSGMPGGLVLADFVQSYLVDTFSLGVPVLAFVQARESQAASLTAP